MFSGHVLHWPFIGDLIARLLGKPATKEGSDMIVWSGLGMLTALFALLAVGIGAVLQPLLDGNGLGQPAEIGLAIGLLVAAAVNWIVGHRLNKGPGREMIDAKTGQRVLFRRRHTLFWIPMQYISVVFIVVALAAAAGLLDQPAPTPAPTAQPT